MQVVNEGFECIGCGALIPPANKTSRNHCSQCFLSMHVDDQEPGDRMSTCGGRMIPVTYIFGTKETKLQFFCVSCGHIHRNKNADDDNLGEIDLWIQFRKQKYAHLMRKAKKV